MKLEERLTAHFVDTGSKLDGPPGRFDAVVAASQVRSPLMRIVLGAGVVGSGAVLVGLLVLLAARFQEGETVGSETEPTRVVVSPYVAVQNGPTGGGDGVIFTVTTDRPSYWRIASLDVYDGDIWKLAGEFETGLRGVDPNVDPGGDRVTVRQEFDIVDLNAIWLPVAPEPVEISVKDGIPVAVDPRSGTVSVASDRQDSDGLSYTVVSSVSAPSADQLREAGPGELDAIGPSHLETDGFPSLVGAVARQLTDGLGSDYDRLIAIQNHLRSFDHTSAPGARTEGVDPAVRFLEAGEGTSGDFASVFAMMARELGIPSRVAVGYSSGQPTGQGETSSGSRSVTFEVRGGDVHAWPEVYFRGAGWVAFEPTPGRQIPGAASYIGVPNG